ncbi:hypothetical protein OEA41_002771 [Lepraria neglecta]|uniref:Uncharacterized protein n=1 Tax=Lepraria neglecta TaxID=209136 RepID=A0AAD9Z3D1_9LECA|nr:hypothetical protein OEA41_002771 [Lepraria neglecta]
MAATLPALLATLTDSLNLASSSIPDATSLAPPIEGISLLDTKNELLLSYLHNLVFLIILKLRNQSLSNSTNGDYEPSPEPLNGAVTKKLVELKVYIEKGVRPLESRLKYQLDKLLLAASEASTAPATTGTAKAPRTSNGVKKPDVSESDSDVAPQPPAQIPELAYRPNSSAFARPSRDTKPTSQDTSNIYRPPRITPTSLPTTERKEKLSRPRKSTTLDAFIREEMTDAPIAEPSIGAGSGLRGKARDKEEERRGYEETRLVRLPGEKKKKRRGGEDLAGGLEGWRDFEFGDLKGGKGKRKRDGDGGGGRVGEGWEKRAKRGVGRKRR